MTGAVDKVKLSSEQEGLANDALEEVVKCLFSAISYRCHELKVVVDR